MSSPRFDPRKAELVQLCAFLGCGRTEAAELLEISLTTAKRDFRMARAWLANRLQRQDLGRGLNGAPATAARAAPRGPARRPAAAAACRAWRPCRTTSTPADDDGVDGRRAMAGKDVRVERVRRGQSGDERMRAVEHHEVGALARAPTPPPAAPPPPRRRPPPPASSPWPRAATGRRGHVAPPGAQALRVLEQAQLLGGVHRDVAVGARRPSGRDAARGPRRAGRRCRRRGWLRSWDTGPPRRPWPRPARFVGAHVRGVHETPARVDRRVIEQPLDRPLPAPRQALVHLALLLGHVDVDRAPSDPGHPRPRAPRCIASGVTARSECTARPTRASTGRRTRGASPPPGAAASRWTATNRRWPSVGATPPKPPC